MSEQLMNDKRAIITGGARGLGLAIARRFVAQGAFVGLIDRNEEDLARAAQLLGSDVMTLHADVCDVPSLTASISKFNQSAGGIDTLINNAGIVRDRTIKNLSYEDWQAVVDVNLTASFNATKISMDYMRQRNFGSIVFMSSISGKVGNFGQANYAAAKAGLIALMKVTAKEGARYGIRSNAVQPGIIDTDMTLALSEEVRAQKLAEVPLARSGTPDEVANVVLFLASGMSSYVTGATIEVTGGRYM